MKSLAILAACLLSACATCNEHPVACGAAVILVSGSIAAASVNHGGAQTQLVNPASVHRPVCAAGPC